MLALSRTPNRQRVLHDFHQQFELARTADERHQVRQRVVVAAELEHIHRNAGVAALRFDAAVRARVVAGTPGFGAAVEGVIRKVLTRQRDAKMIAEDVADMRRAIAMEKGEGTRWDLKYAAGGLIDLEFIAQYLQLVHADKHPDILDTSTARVFDKARRLGALPAEEADVLRPAAALYHNLTQILRLCLPGPFDPKAAGPGLLGLLARAADLPDFATVDAHVAETQRKVRASFARILGEAP